MGYNVCNIFNWFRKENLAIEREREKKEGVNGVKRYK